MVMVPTLSVISGTLYASASWMMMSRPSREYDETREI
jgi:hypothetical protein